METLYELGVISTDENIYIGKKICTLDSEDGYIEDYTIEFPEVENVINKLKPLYEAISENKDFKMGKIGIHVGTMNC